MFLNICSINIRSLIPKLDELKKVIADNNYDIIAIQESWLTKDNTKFAKVKGYKTIATTPSTRKGSGVLFFVKDNLSTKTIKTVNLKDNIEMILIKIEKVNRLGHIYLANTYIHPTGNADSIDLLTNELKNFK